MEILETYYGKIYPNEWSKFKNIASALAAGSNYVIVEYLDVSLKNRKLTEWFIYDSSSQKITSVNRGKWKLSNIVLIYHGKYYCKYDVIDPIGVKESQSSSSSVGITSVFDMMLNWLDDASGFLSLKELQLRKENLKLKEETERLKKEISQLRKGLE